MEERVRAEDTAASAAGGVREVVLLELPAHTSLSAQGAVWATGSGLFGLFSAAGNAESIWSWD